MKLVSTLFMMLLVLLINAQEKKDFIPNIQLKSFAVQDQSIKEALEKLEKQSSIKIGYAVANKTFDKKITLSLKNVTIKEILNQLFSNTRYQFKVLKKKILIYKKREDKASKHTIHGFVKEKGSEEYIAGVTIYIPELGIGTTTNAYGFYSLTSTKGMYKIRFSFMGYEKRTKEVNLAEDIALTVVLEPKEEQLEEVLISDQKITKDSRSTQMGLHNLQPSDVANVPAFLGEKDVFKTLQLLPGIQSGLEAGSGLYIRGGAPDQNLVILDEAPVYNFNHAFGLFSAFNGDAIKSTAVYKGGFPAQYGGRLSSVIDIRMKDGNKEKFGGKVSMGLLSSSAFIEGPINAGKTSFIANARRTYADLISLPFQPKDKKVGYYFQDLNFKIHHVFNEKNKLFWSAYYSQDKFSSKTNNNSEKSTNKIAWGNITATLRWNHQFSKKLFANTSFIFSNYLFKVASANSNPDQNLDFNFKSSSGINDYGLKTDFVYHPNPKHTWRFGGMTTYHNFTPQRVAQRELGVRDINKEQVINSLENAVYIADHWSISNRWSVTSGLRFSSFIHKSTPYTALEPRLEAAYRIKPTWSIKTAYSRMSQYIHLLTNSGLGLPADLWVSSTENVRPQQSEQIAFGAVKDFENTGYALSIEGYYKKMNQIIAYKEGASLLVLNDIESGKNVAWEENITTGQGWAYGAEILFRKQRGRLTGWIGYTVSKSERQFDAINLARKFNAKYDRRHSIALVAIYKPQKKLILSANWVYASGLRYTLPNVQTISSDNQFPIVSGSEDQTDVVYEFATERNNFKGHASHRLDLSAQFHKKTKRNRERTWGVSLYNSYANRNPFFYYVNSSDVTFTSLNSVDNRANQKTVRQYALLVCIPSVNYTLKF